MLRVGGWLAGASLLGLVGCAPVLSQKVLKQAGEPVDFADLQAHPESWQGKVVILGGTLLQVHEEPGGSVLEILERPLDYRLRPIPGDLSRGRFLVRLAGEADSRVWTPGRWLTLAGRVVGVETRPIGQTAYRYPVMTLEEVHLGPRPGEPVHRPWVFFGIGGSVPF